MHIGMIGIGDIAQKAYLPILGTRENIRLSLASRNQKVLQRVGNQYGISSLHTNVQDLIRVRVDAVFVHTATEAHAKIVEELILAGIPVFVDKPIAYTLEQTENLINLAESKHVPLWVGFNRRFAPFYRNLPDQIKQFDTVIMQKNRLFSPAPVQNVVFDDFIHVIDTLLFLAGNEYPEQLTIHGRVKKEGLAYLTVQWFDGITTAFGMMNRDSGATDESVEVTGDKKKIIVDKLVKHIGFEHNMEQHQYFEDWKITLYRRGFVDLIEHVLHSIESGKDSEIAGRNVIVTHQVCNAIVQKLEQLQTLE